MRFVVVAGNAPAGAALLNLSLHCPAVEGGDGTEGSMSLNVPIEESPKYPVGATFELSFKKVADPAPPPPPPAPDA